MNIREQGVTECVAPIFLSSQLPSHRQFRSPRIQRKITPDEIRYNRSMSQKEPGEVIKHIVDIGLATVGTGIVVYMATK